MTCRFNSPLLAAEPNLERYNREEGGKEERREGRKRGERRGREEERREGEEKRRMEEGYVQGKKKKGRKSMGRRNGKERREKRNLKKKREEERKREKESRESVRLYLKFSASVGTFLGCSLIAAPVVSPGYEPSGNQQIMMH